jgi:hypothetical protein
MVNCERSESFNPDDRLRIFECVRKTVGFAALDRTVFKVWLFPSSHPVQRADAAICRRFLSAGYCLSSSASSSPAASLSQPLTCTAHAVAFFTIWDTTTTQHKI